MQNKRVFENLRKIFCKPEFRVDNDEFTDYNYGKLNDGSIFRSAFLFFGILL